MVRLVEVPLHHRGQPIGTRLEEVRPPRCDNSHSLRWTGRQPCPTCGLDVVQYWCGRGCPAVVDPDHEHGDPRDWATVVKLDGTTERVQR